MTEKWIEQTVRALLDRATVAIADLNQELAGELVSTARQLDPQNLQLDEIAEIISGLSDSPKIASQDPTPASLHVAEDFADSHLQNAVLEHEVDTLPKPDYPSETDTVNRVTIPGWRIGIDFGTSNTRVALSDPDGSVQILTIGSPTYDPRMLPSVVALHRKDGSTPAIVGERALELEGDPNWAVVRNIKRLLVVETDPQDAGILTHFSDVVRKKFEFLSELPNSQTSDSIARLIIDEALNRAQNEIDNAHEIDNSIPLLDIRGLPVTFGVWGAAGLVARKTAGGLIDENTDTPERPVCDFEPSLAAQSSVKYDPIGSKGISVIFDLGGGTFDVCTVRVDEDEQISVLSTDSVPLAGGSDIERSVMRSAVEKIAAEMGFSTDDVMEVIEKEPVARGSLEAQIRTAIIDHSRFLEIPSVITLNDFISTDSVSISLTEADISAAVMRAEIDHEPGDSGNWNLITHILECFRFCILRARNISRPSGSALTTKFEKVLEEGFIDRVILVGGGSQFPEIEKVVYETVPNVNVEVDTDLNAGTNPLFAIVRGASLTNADSRSSVIDRPSVSLHINGERIYSAFTSTFVHAPNQLSGGITARQIDIGQTLNPGWVATIIDETGDTLLTKVGEDRVQSPSCRFTRMGQFVITDGVHRNTRTIDLPNRSIWQIELDEELTRLADTAKLEQDEALHKKLIENRYW
jgi:hypothetical protein